MLLQPAAQVRVLLRQLQRLAECRERLVRRPHVKEAAGLGFYTTTLAMQDLDAVREVIEAQLAAFAVSALGTVVGFPLFLALALRHVDAQRLGDWRSDGRAHAGPPGHGAGGDGGGNHFG